MRSLDAALSEILVPNPVEAAFLKQGYRFSETAPSGGVVTVSNPFPKGEMPSEAEIADLCGFIEKNRARINGGFTAGRRDSSEMERFLEALRKPTTGLQACVALAGPMPGGKRVTFEPTEFGGSAHWLACIPDVGYRTLSGNRVMLAPQNQTWHLTFGEEQDRSLGGVASSVSPVYWTPSR